MLKVCEVTDPPFLERRLPELHIELRVVSGGQAAVSKDVSLEKLLRTKTKLKLEKTGGRV